MINNMLLNLYIRMKDDRGASIVEYSLLIVLIALVALVAVQLAGSSLSTTYSEIASEVANAS